MDLRGWIAAARLLPSVSGPYLEVDEVLDDLRGLGLDVDTERELRPVLEKGRGIWT